MTRAPRKSTLNGRSVRLPVSHAKTEVENDADDDTTAAGTAADETSAVQPPVDALSELMTSLQGATSARINVYRIVKNQPPSYVFECSPESFSLDELRDKYNGGEFRLYVMKEGRLWKNTRVIVEPRQIINSGNDPSPPSQMFDMMALIRDGFSAQTTAMREIAAGRTGGPSLLSGMDLPAVITAAAAAITALRPPPAPPPAPVQDTTSQALDMFMKGMQIAMDVRDNTPTTDNSIGGMLREVLRSPILAASVQAATAQPAPQAPRAPAQQFLAGPVPTVSHAKTDVVQPPKTEDVVLKYYLDFLVQKAASGADPDLYAEFVLDNLTDEQLVPMIERGPLLIEDFVSTCPAVSTHRDWFVSLIAAVTLAMSATDDSNPTKEPSNATDAASVIVPGNPAE